jgi:hypothetical protein
MAVCIDQDHKVVGRALIWNTDNAGLCMDTIYASDSIQPMFIDFAIRNGMRYKSSQSCHHHDFDLKDRQSVRVNMQVSVTLRNWDHCYYPYMDSLKYLCEDTGRLLNYEPSGDYRILRETDGSWEDTSCNVTCIVSGDRIHEDDAQYLDYRNSNGRYIDGYAHTDHCVDTNEGWRLEEDSVHISGHGYYSLGSRHIVHVDYASDWYHIDDIVYDAKGGAIIYDDAIELHDGNYARIDDCVQLENGMWALAEDTVSDKTTGKIYLTNSYSDVATKTVYND